MTESRPKTGYAICSCNGFAREILPIAEAQLPREDDVRRLLYAPRTAAPDIVWVEVDPAVIGTIVNGWPVIDFETLCSPAHRHRLVSVAIANPRRRAEVVAQCRAAGLSFVSLIASSAIIDPTVTLGEGAILCPNTILTANATIGVHCHVNMGTYIAHDCVIGDYVTFAPGVCCNGRVVIEEGAYLGTNAMIRQGTEASALRIGRDATVGMGAVVTKDVPAGMVVIGNPARPLAMPHVTRRDPRDDERARLLAALPAFIPAREFEGSTGDFWANGFNTCLVRVRRLLERSDPRTQEDPS